MGYGDLGIYGHPTIFTPNLDKMALSSFHLTNFYVASPVCSPSRASLLTGKVILRLYIILKSLCQSINWCQLMSWDASDFTKFFLGLL